MQMYTIVPPSNDEPMFVLCADHRMDRAQALAAEGMIVLLNGLSDAVCAECLEAGDEDDGIDPYDSDDDRYDDGDYPGVERDENMSRIEGDDFWMGDDGGDY